MNSRSFDYKIILCLFASFCKAFVFGAGLDKDTYSRLANDKKTKQIKPIEAGRLIEHFVAGITARCAADLVGVNFKTAAYFYHRLREIICLATTEKRRSLVKLKWMKAISVTFARASAGVAQQAKFRYLASLNVTAGFTRRSFLMPPAGR